MVVFAQTTNAQTPPHQQLDVPEGSNASLNWSGYVADANTSGTTAAYTSVTGTWVVPSVSATSSANAVQSADATWVGVGGVESRDLIQAGTQAIVEDGTVTYSAWIETLPGFSRTVSLAVQSGDSVTATLAEESDGIWRITIANNTRGTSYSRTVAYDSSLSSAEWVEEMVSNAGARFIPLDSFGSVTFTNAAATVNGSSQNLSELGAQPLQMVGGGQTLATASTLNNDNQSFSVTRSTETPATEAVAEQQSEADVPVIVIVHYRHDGIPAVFSIIGL